MSNGYDSTQSLGAAEQITLDELIEATSSSVRRAVKDHEARPQSSNDLATIFIGLILD